MFHGGLRLRRATVCDARGFCRWAVDAKAGDACTYHIGNLVADRAIFPELHLLAETVLLFQERGYVVGSQSAVSLPTISGREYLVARTGTGKAPKAVLAGSVTATQFRALQAIGERPSAVSVTRAVRDALSLSETHAKLLVASLQKRGWVIEQPVKGWGLSSVGAKMIL